MTKTRTFKPHFYQLPLLRLLGLLMGLGLAALPGLAEPAAAGSQLLEAAGQVEYLAATATNWQTAGVGLLLHPGDRLRTRAQSRAALQLSDRSVIRLDELTTLEILAPRTTARKRFSLWQGALYFFNRERPADVEFDTPLAAGAIRGTEFLLAVDTEPPAVQLALIDGLVDLRTTEDQLLKLHAGQNVQLNAGRPPVLTALLNAPADIQWALYYPAIVYPAELNLAPGERARLSGVLRRYQAGDLLGALAAWPATGLADRPGTRILHAQLVLAVGQVAEARRLLASLPGSAPATALLELMDVVAGRPAGPRIPTASPSLLLAQSYVRQRETDLPAALTAAAQATELAPDFGFAWVRRASLEFAFGHRRASLAQLERGLALSPRLAAGRALQGFVWFDQGEVRSALAAFDQARALDAALGEAWLGRGLCLSHANDFTGAQAAFQVAAALEPQRSLFRSYLGKVASQRGDAPLAAKEFRLAKGLDPGDPTPWLYSALELWQENQLNAAIRDLETSADKNDNRAVFRSRELLDNDRSVRSANLAAIYQDAGLDEVSRRVASRAVDESYANFSGHLMLADSYQTAAGANGFDQRLETARQSELLVANLLAPPGAGNLSQVLSESDRLRYFAEQTVGASSVSSYGSRGDWAETATVFGSSSGLDYAFDLVNQGVNGQGANNDLSRHDYILTLKPRVTVADEAYFQIGSYSTTAGDLSRRYDPASATPGLGAQEKQQPELYAGWHHTWGPGSHTLLLAGRLDDRFSLQDPHSDQLFLVQTNDIRFLDVCNG